ncbi:MAG: hypothetical protein MJ149_01195 [Clostridia bacterium]|nr:hypothetical protein [Clostridia bacterium]
MYIQPADVKTRTRTNKYVLQFYMHKEDGSNYLTFSYNQTWGVYVSETIAPKKEVYIKYVDTGATDDIADKPHVCTIENYYKGDFAYLKNYYDEYVEGKHIKCLSTKLDFSMKSGINSLDVEAGELTYSAGRGNVVVVKEEGATTSKLIPNEGYIYLNRDMGIDNASANAYLFIMRDGAIKDVNGQPINEATLNIKIEGGANDPVTIKQYSTSDGNAKSKVGTSTSIVYNYQHTGNAYNAIIFAFDSATDLGEYKITIICGNGFTQVIRLLLYEALQSSDITYTIGLNDKCFENKTQDGGKFQYFDGTQYKDYAADYIAAVSPDAIKLNASIKDYFGNRNWKFAISSDVNLNEDSYIKVTKDLANIGNANILFKKGTYYSGSNHYERIYIYVEDQQYSDILTKKSSTDYVHVELTFFIYEPIEEKDLVLKLGGETITKPITRYMFEYMGAYYIDLSKADLSVDMRSDLWNYTQHQVQLADYKIGESGNYNTVWKTAMDNDLDVEPITTESQDSTAISLRFNKFEETTYTIYAYVKQFNTTYTRICNIAVKKPVLSTGVIVKSVLATEEGKTYKINTTESGEHVLNLKAGESCQIVGSTITSHEGVQVTHPDIVVVVVDRLGTYVDSDVVYVDHNTNTITVADSFDVDKLKILVFAKDVLTQQIIRDDKSRSFANPASWLIDVGYHNLDEEVQGLYTHAYQTITLTLSDGTEDNPYYIYDAEDLLEINSSEAMKSKYYRLGSSINLNGKEVVFDNFTGHIDTENDEVLTISGVKLTSAHKNLFTNFAGTITNIKFVVDYDVDLVASSTTKIGVFDVNKGTLNNVSVEYSGKLNLTGTGTTYIGSLVAENRGDITYTTQINGATGTVEISGTGIVKFGGLVGLNDGNIIGYYEETTTVAGAEPQFVTHIDGADTLSYGEIDARSLSNTSSAVGGLVGHNKGLVSTGFVSVKIYGNYNLGGVVGENENEETSTRIVRTADTEAAPDSLSTNERAASIIKITSNSKVYGLQNLGGITGKDSYGYYSQCRYQIYSTDATNLSGQTNVGGLIGYAFGTFVENSSTYSYKLNYATATLGGSADISASNYAGGLIGYAQRTATHYAKEINANTVAIQLSSVNAYIHRDASVGGITCVGGQSIYIIDSYFIGKVESPQGVVEGLCLANNANYQKNYVYSVNNGVATNTYFGAIKENSSHQPPQTIRNWAYNKELNGGYIYIEYENKPIFEISPIEN